MPEPSLSELQQELARRGVRREYRPHLLLIQEGDVGDTLFLILSGSVRVFSSDDRGREVTLAVHGAGEYVGEMSLDGGPRSASVETLAPTTCAVITREQLLAFIADHPAFAMDLIARLIRRARLATENARTMALIDVYGRLARLLDQLAGPADARGHRRVAERLTHQQIAGYLACSREMVSRLMKDLENGQYLRMQDRRIVLLGRLPPRW